MDLHPRAPLRTIASAHELPGGGGAVLGSWTPAPASGDGALRLDLVGGGAQRGGRAQRSGRGGGVRRGGERGEDEWVVRERRVGYTASWAFWAQNSSETRVALNASLCRKHNAKKIVRRGIIEPATSHTGTTMLYHCTNQEILL